MDKDFEKWNKLKIKLDNRSYIPPIVKEGEVYWFSVGLNIGKEINGKSKYYTRPALIYKVISKTTYFVIPLTTSDKYEDKWHMEIFNFENKTKSNLCFNQAKVLDFKRIGNFIFSLDLEMLKKVEERFMSLYKINLTPPKAGVDRDTP